MFFLQSAEPPYLGFLSRNLSSSAHPLLCSTFPPSSLPAPLKHSERRPASHSPSPSPNPEKHIGSAVHQLTLRTAASPSASLTCPLRFTAQSILSPCRWSHRRAETATSSAVFICLCSFFWLLPHILHLLLSLARTPWDAARGIFHRGAAAIVTGRT